MSENIKVVKLNSYERKKLIHHDRAKQTGGDDGMDGNDYVTHRELDNTVGSLRREIGLRFDNVGEKIESSKRDTIYEIKELIHKQNDDQARAKTQTIRWVVGTGIAVIGLTFTIIKFFI